MNIDRLIAQIKEDEGFTPVATWDREQFSYGYGCRAPHEGATITEPVASVLLNDEVLSAMKDFMDIYPDCQEDINDIRAEALVNMCFNLGKTKMLKFRKMNASIERNDWMGAAHQAVASDWYRQVGNRAKRIVKELATGEKEEG
jgi:GH24 family phage-related lysozyme (muramidase)